MTSPEMQDFLHQKANSHGSNSNSKSKATLLDRFLSRGSTKIDRTGQNIMQDGDAYPYRYFEYPTCNMWYIFLVYCF